MNLMTKMTMSMLSVESGLKVFLWCFFLVLYFYKKLKNKTMITMLSVECGCKPAPTFLWYLEKNKMTMWWSLGFFFVWYCLHIFTHVSKIKWRCWVWSLGVRWRQLFVWYFSIFCSFCTICFTNVWEKNDDFECRVWASPTFCIILVFFLQFLKKKKMMRCWVSSVGVRRRLLPVLLTWDMASPVATGWHN